MYVNLLTVIQEVWARGGCRRGTPVYLDTRPEGAEPPPQAFRKVEYECENGMKLVVDYDEQGRILGMEVWPIVESEQPDTSCEPRPPAPPKGEG
ncbi:MAG: hypothetical protein AMXMBFR61_04380 [Fimbriimonadales bacterium]